MNLNNIIKEIDSNGNKLLSNIDLIFKSKILETNKNISHFQVEEGGLIKVFQMNTLKIDIPLNLSVANVFNIDITHEIIKIIKENIVNSIHKEFYRNFQKQDYISYPIEKNQTLFEMNDKFIRELVLKSKMDRICHCISSPLVSTNISDSSNLSYSNKSYTTVISSNIYQLGVLGGINFYVDPKTHWEDNRIFQWEDATIYLAFDSIFELVDPMSMNNKISIILKYYIDIKSPRILYVLENENSPGYNLFISDMRDKKIDELLDGRE